MGGVCSHTARWTESRCSEGLSLSALPGFSHHQGGHSGTRRGLGEFSALSLSWLKWSRGELNSRPLLVSQVKLRPFPVPRGGYCWGAVCPAVSHSASVAIGCVLLPRGSQQCGSVLSRVGGCRRLFSGKVRRRRARARTCRRGSRSSRRCQLLAVGRFKTLPKSGRLSMSSTQRRNPSTPWCCCGLAFCSLAVQLSTGRTLACRIRMLSSLAL